jgi:hypothetical protein
VARDLDVIELLHDERRGINNFPSSLATWTLIGLFLPRRDALETEGVAA